MRHSNTTPQTEAQEQEEWMLTQLQAAELTAFPKINWVAYGTLLAAVPLFEYGFTYLDLHRNLWAHLVFYALLSVLVREFFIRKTGKLKDELTYPVLVGTLSSSWIFTLVCAVFAVAALVHIHRAAFAFPVVAFACAVWFYSLWKFSPQKYRLIAYAQAVIAAASLEVLPKNGGMDYLWIFTSLLAASFYVCALI